MRLKTVTGLLTVWTLMGAAPAVAQSITATFTRGAVAAYSGNPNATDDAVLLSSLNIASITISQESSTGQWGGSQGNDTAVMATITFNNGAPAIVFPAAINWVKNAGSGEFDWVGLTIASDANIDDGYAPGPGFSKTYILQFSQSSLDLATLLPNDLDGSANEGAALGALNQYFPNATPPVITDPNGGAVAPSFTVNENEINVTTLAADRPVTWAITGGSDAGRFAISPSGVITFVTAPDFENPSDSDSNNNYYLTVTATDSNGNAANQMIKLRVLDLDEVAPVVATEQFISYVENQSAGAPLGIVSASDDFGVTGYRFTASGTATSPDGFYSIDDNGAISLTAAGAAAGALTNVFQTNGSVADFNNPPNRFTFGIQARDAAANWSESVNVTLAVTDSVDVAPPVITGPTGGAGAASSAVAVNENQTDVATLSADKAVTWAISDGDDGGRFAISLSGAITFVVAPDFESPTDSDTNNSYTLTVTATDGDGNSASQTVTVTVLDLDDTAPSVAAGQRISYSESQEAGTVLGTAVATDASGVTAFRFAETGNSTSADGLFMIFNNGSIRLTAAGAAAGAATNDFEIAPNTFTYAIEAGDAAGNWSAAVEVEFNVTDLDDTAPVIIGPTGGAGAASSAVSVNENQTEATTLNADDAVTWTITGGNDAGRFAINSSGAITFATAPDFENPSDSDSNNTYTLTVTATDNSGNATNQTVTVTVLDLDDTAPVITVPGARPGDEPGASVLNVAEGQTSVTTLGADEAVSWLITGGNDSGRFAITPSGTITFVAAPDYEAPGDSDANNSYVLTVQAADAQGNQGQQTITVLVTNIDDTGPVITGPSGGPGATASSVIVTEGLTTVASLTADESVTWAISGGADSGRFAISPSGMITFLAPPDYENPVDSDTNNRYVIEVRARDTSGNFSTQTITVIVADLNEIARKLDEIGGSLRGDLRGHAFNSLSSMLAFNEGLLTDNGRDAHCAETGREKTVSGRLNANETRQSGKIDFNRRLNACSSRTRLYADSGLTASRLDGNWTSRGFASVRIEHSLSQSTVLGAGLQGSFASDQLSHFNDSQITDQSIQLNLYARTRLTDRLRLAGFGGIGKAWYDFRLNDDQLALTGTMTGTRHFYGAALSGDVRLGGLVFNTDLILSRAVENLGSATLAAKYLGEERSGIAFDVGRVDTTRLSVPLRLPISLGTDAHGQSKGRLDFSSGLLCEDISATSSPLHCGYQLGFKFLFAPSSRLRITGETRYERVEDYQTQLFSFGLMRSFGPQDAGSLGLDLRGTRRGYLADGRVLVTIRLNQ